jgi:hypothetical protein
MPNDSEETARVLDNAGGWLKSKDPQSANRFFQALAIRCGNTAIGKAAAKGNWFLDKLYCETTRNMHSPFPAELPAFNSDGPANFDWRRYINRAYHDAEKAFRANVALAHGYELSRFVRGSDDSGTGQMTRYNLASDLLSAANKSGVEIHRARFASTPELLAAFDAWLAAEETALDKLQRFVGKSWQEGSGARVFHAETRMLRHVSLRDDLDNLRIVSIAETALAEAAKDSALPERNKGKIAAIRKKLGSSPERLSAFEDWLASEQGTLEKWRVCSAKARVAGEGDTDKPDNAEKLAAAILARELGQRVVRSLDLQDL